MDDTKFVSKQPRIVTDKKLQYIFENRVELAAKMAAHIYSAYIVVEKAGPGTCSDKFKSKLKDNSAQEALDLLDSIIDSTICDIERFNVIVKEEYNDNYYKNKFCFDTETEFNMLKELSTPQTTDPHPSQPVLEG